MEIILTGEMSSVDTLSGIQWPFLAVASLATKMVLVVMSNVVGEDADTSGHHYKPLLQHVNRFLLQKQKQ
ncbi:hypothetical protein CHUAL_007171 [Chamberlinius hualienensis]